MIGMNVRDQRRLTLVVESAYHICCGDFQDYLQAISLDGISHHGGENLGWETHVSKAENFTIRAIHTCVVPVQSCNGQRLVAKGLQPSCVFCLLILKSEGTEVC